MTEKNYATVSLKGSGKDALWIVLNGSADEMVQQIKDIFKFPKDQIEGLEPIELIINADSTLKAMTTVSGQLGGTAIRDVSKPSAPADKTGGWHGEHEQGHGDAWERAGATESTAQAPSDPEPESAPENGSQESSPHAELFAKMEACSSIKELQDVWAANKAAFKEDAVVSKYKEVGARLKEAGA